MVKGTRGSLTRSTLLRAASSLLLAGGPDAVTLRAVGTAANVSRTTPYRHFKDKDELLSAVAAENLEFLEAAMRDGANAPPGDMSPLCGACLGYIKGAMARPAHYRLVFGDFPIGSPSQALGNAATSCMNYLYELVGLAQPSDTRHIEGYVRKVTALVWAALHGLVDLTLASHLREPRTVDGASTMPDLVKFLLAALRLA